MADSPHSKAVPKIPAGASSHPRATSVSGDSSHHGASRTDRELYTWLPPRRSADDALLPDLNTLVSRIQDLTRNSGALLGGVQLFVDMCVGTGLQLRPTPSYELLGQSADWARTWSRHVQARFNNWARDLDCPGDLNRRLTFAGRLSQVARTLISGDGEALAIAEWRRRPDAYSTTIRLVDPARLETPPELIGRTDVAGGIRYHRDGYPLTYYIRDHHPSDTRHRGRPVYRSVPATTPWGRRRVLHVYDPERPAQSRGKSALSAVVKRIKKLESFEDATLESAIVNAVFAAVIESELASAMEAIGGTDMADYAKQLIEWHSDKGILFDGVKIPHLYPGEKLHLNRPEQPTANFSDFSAAFNRDFASALGLSYEQFARDYSDTSYSGAQSGRQDSWRTVLSRRALVARTYASQEYALWLEEAISRGDVPIPEDAPSFLSAKGAYCSCDWLGPARGHLNPLQEAQAHAIELENGSSTLDEWCGQQGRVWEEVLEQRARELQKIQQLESELGISFKLTD